MVNFVTGCCLESVTEEMKVNPAAAHYPDYVREKTGIAEFYAFAIWPAAQFPDMKEYVQAVPAVGRFISKFRLTAKAARFDVSTSYRQ